MDTYLASYRDAHGEIPATLDNDGETIRLSFEGLAFEGSDLDGLTPVSLEEARASPRVLLSPAGYELCAFSLSFEMPVQLLLGGQAVGVVLGVKVAIGESVGLWLTLAMGELRLASSGASGWFEDEMLDLQRQLPDNGRFKTCIGCGLSDYSPYGHGLFGSLACFRTNKERYRAVNSKTALFEIWETRDRFVQETYLCPDFEPRRPGAGYRG